MPSTAAKRRLANQKLSGQAPKRRKIFKRKVDYHSSSSESGSDDDEVHPPPADETSAANLTQLGKRVPTKSRTDAAAGSLEDNEPGSDTSDEAGDLEVDTEDLDSSEDDENDVDDEQDEVIDEEDEVDEEEDSDDDDGGDDNDEDDLNGHKDSKGKDGQKRKRSDPAAFAASMDLILGSKLTSTKKLDPVLSRSKDASTAVKEQTEAKLDAKARQKLRDERKSKLDQGRVKDVLGLNDAEVSTEDIMATEKKLKKLAQQGVIRLFNAVLAAQVRGQQAARGSQKAGVVGIDKRNQTVQDMSKQGFLDLIAGGGGKK